MYYIVYNADTLVLLGLTQNCYERFGLPSSIVYGLSSKSFTIDNIFKNINDSEFIEKLTSNLIEYKMRMVIK